MRTGRDLTHHDPVVQEVLDIWLPRFLNGGIAIGDIVATLRNVDSWEEWGSAWSATAEIHEQLARDAASQGHARASSTAREDAARCHHLAYFLSVADAETHESGLRRMVECHDQARPLMQPAVEKVTITGADDLKMVALLSSPGPDSPVLIVLPGLDSTKETRHSSRAAWMALGFAVMSLDGPGQGESSLWSTARPDYEVAISAAIDWLETRADLDAGRIGLMGASLGGYYAPRAAACDDRIAATIANCGPFDWSECWDVLPVVTREAFVHYSGSGDVDSALAKAREFTLEDVIEQLESPLLVVHGSDDPLIPWQQGERIAERASGPSEFLLVEQGNHGVNNLSYRWVPYAKEWLVANVIGAR